MWTLAKILLFICILQNILFWPLEIIPMPWMVALVSLLILSLNLPKWGIKRIPIKTLIFITFLLIIHSIIVSGFTPSISLAVFYLIGISILKLNDRKKDDLLFSITTWFSILIIISLSFYCLWLILRFPPFSILKEPYGYYDMQNYFFFVISVFSGEIPRFSGPFIEPGHFGLVCSFLLFACKYDFKEYKCLWPILLGLLFSLSLAGYLLLFIGFLLNKGIRFRKIVLISIFLGISYVSVTELWNHGDNPLNERIFKRLEYDEEKGISGNNRNLYGTELYFLSMIDKGNILYGIGSKEYTLLAEQEVIGGAGITVFLIQNGIIGLLLVLAYYSCVPMFVKNRIFMWKFLFLLCLCFLQRAYPFWIAWLLPYMSSTRMFSIKK